MALPNHSGYPWFGDIAKDLRLRADKNISRDTLPQRRLPPGIMMVYGT